MTQHKPLPRQLFVAREPVCLLAIQVFNYLSTALGDKHFPWGSYRSRFRLSLVIITVGSLTITPPSTLPRVKGMER